ncbi:MAG: hypothetical protein EPO27_20385 [Betaproteobacteria bacterium]|nr:MAG: hypothetical protein EPO27_20385 [Betaproteobacteria bacterium]
MFRGRFAMLLLALSGGAGADWTPVAADNGIFSAYADRATIERSGSLVRMQGMYDFAKGDLTPTGVGFFSTTVQREYDCSARKVRLIAHADHSERFGAGRVVSAANRPRPWETVVEGGIDDAYWRFACGEI